MASILTRAHWSDVPVAGVHQQPPPAWTAGYPGTVPLQDIAGGPPSWQSQPNGPVPEAYAYQVWLPVVRQADLDSAGWAAGPTWAGAPPPYWPVASGVPAATADRGYGPGASGFRVTRLRIFQDAPPGGDYTFTVVAPNGANLGTVTSANGWTPWLTVVGAPADGRGIWTVTINRAPGSSAAAPALLPTPTAPGNAVAEPYVSPYGDRFEGVLGAEFDGEEIRPGPLVAVTPTVVVGSCDGSGSRGPSTLTLTFAPPLAPGWTGEIEWQLANGAQPIKQPIAVPPAGPPTSSESRQVSYPPGAYFPSATVTLFPPGGGPLQSVTVYFPASGTGLVVGPCPTACHDLTLRADTARPCLRGSGAATVTFTADLVPVVPAYPGLVTWQIRDANGVLLTLPSPTPHGPVLTFDFQVTGTYEVTALIVRPGCEPSLLSDTATVTVTDCSASVCPTVTGVPTATATGPCRFDFSVAVANPSGLPTSLSWDFGDGATAGGSPVTHTFTPGNHTVTATVTSPGCPPSSTTTTVTCAGPPPPPPPGSGGGGCTPACTVAGILFLVAPISAYISAVAHCLLPALAASIAAAAILATVGLFLRLCGPCCLWPFLVAGAIGGVVATFVAWIWLGPPTCWPAGLALVIGFLTLAFGVAAVCSSSSSPKPAATADSALTGSAGTASPGSPRGLGDVIATATRAVGIPPCEPCARRAETLNRLLPLTHPPAERT